jgi:hypothetical protein
MSVSERSLPCDEKHPAAPTSAGPHRFWRLAVAAGAVTVVAGLLAVGIYVPRPRHAEIRVPGPDDQVPLERFHTNGARNSRSIATITTCFTRRTWLTTELYAVLDGNVSLIDHHVTGRSSVYSRPSDPYLMTFPVTFALADAESRDGHTTLVTMRGASHSHGNSGAVHNHFAVTATKTLTGRINPGETRLLYVEADRPFVATPEMTSEEFLARNPAGNFLIVVLRFDR